MRAESSGNRRCFCCFTPCKKLLRNREGAPIKLDIQRPKNCPGAGFFHHMRSNSTATPKWSDRRFSGVGASGHRTVGLARHFESDLAHMWSMLAHGVEEMGSVVLYCIPDFLSCSVQRFICAKESRWGSKISILRGSNFDFRRVSKFMWRQAAWQSWRRCGQWPRA